MCDSARAFGSDILLRHPEARSVLVVFDFHGQLNEAQIQKGVVMGRRGTVVGLDELQGVLWQTFGMVQHLLMRLVSVADKVRAESLKSLKTLLEATQAVRKLETQPHGDKTHEEEQPPAGDGASI